MANQEEVNDEDIKQYITQRLERSKLLDGEVSFSGSIRRAASWELQKVSLRAREKKVEMVKGENLK